MLFIFDRYYYLQCYLPGIVLAIVLAIVLCIVLSIVIIYGIIYSIIYSIIYIIRGNRSGDCSSVEFHAFLFKSQLFGQLHSFTIEQAASERSREPPPWHTCYQVPTKVVTRLTMLTI